MELLLAEKNVFLQQFFLISEASELLASKVHKKNHRKVDAKTVSDLSDRDRSHTIPAQRIATEINEVFLAKKHSRIAIGKFTR